MILDFGAWLSLFPAPIKRFIIDFHAKLAVFISSSKGLIALSRKKETIPPHFILNM